jgi:hypothetical protein
MTRADFSFLLAILVAAYPNAALAQSKPRLIHVLVALADNQHQGIIPVPVALGNGDDPAHNLYWGAAYGVRTFLRKSADWKEVFAAQNPYKGILQRSVFQHRTENVLLIAVAYRGSEMQQAVTDFFRAAAGVNIHQGEPALCMVAGLLQCAPDYADLVVYAGHDGLMDFSLSPDFSARSGGSRQAIVLACASKVYFAALLRSSGAEPLLWTTGLMAPEAYTLEAAMQGWILKESKEQIRRRAAVAYAKYQKCSETAALRLFSAGW